MFSSTLALSLSSWALLMIELLVTSLTGRRFFTQIERSANTAAGSLTQQSTTPPILDQSLRRY